MEKNSFKSNLDFFSTLPEFFSEFETKVEWDIKQSRLIEKLYDQDCIIKQTQKDCTDFDQELDGLQLERLNVVADCVYLELLLLTYHRELRILQKYEEKEDSAKQKLELSMAEYTKTQKNVSVIITINT